MGKICFNGVDIQVESPKSCENLSKPERSTERLFKILWADDLLEKYQKKHNIILYPDDDISGILRELFYEENFECDQETFQDILDYLVRNM